MFENRDHFLEQEDERCDCKHDQEQESERNDAPELHIQPPIDVEKRIEPKDHGTPVRIDCLVERKRKNRKEHNSKAESLPYQGVIDLPRPQSLVHEDRSNERMSERLGNVHARKGAEES